MLTNHRELRRAAFRLFGVLGLLATGMTACAQGPATVVPKPRPGSWMAMHEKFLSQAKKGNIDLLFLGDSITQGWNNNEVWRRHFEPRKAANFGIGGDRTEHVLWRIQNGELEGIAPKVTVLMIGTNNSALIHLRGDRPGRHRHRRRASQAVAQYQDSAARRLPPRREARGHPRPSEVGQRKDRQVERQVSRAVSRHRTQHS